MSGTYWMNPVTTWFSISCKVEQASIQKGSDLLLPTSRRYATISQLVPSVFLQISGSSEQRSHLERSLQRPVPEYVLSQNFGRCWFRNLSFSSSRRRGKCPEACELQFLFQTSDTHSRYGFFSLLSKCVGQLKPLAFGSMFLGIWVGRAARTQVSRMFKMFPHALCRADHKPNG